MSLGRGAGAANHASASEQHVELASEAVVEDRVEECGDEGHARKNHEGVGHGGEVQHDADHSDDESDTLRERWWSRVFEVARRTQARANHCFEKHSVGVTLDAGEGSPSEECSNDAEQNEGRLGGPLPY